jgi:hypothetical protein
MGEKDSGEEFPQLIENIWGLLSASVIAAVSSLVTAAIGAGVGAAIGTEFAPLVGTAIGAVVGAIVGAIVGALPIRSATTFWRLQTRQLPSFFQVPQTQCRGAGQRATPIRQSTSAPECQGSTT